MKRDLPRPANAEDDRTADIRPIRVRVLEKDVQLACRTGDEEALLQAAAYVNTSMRELRQRKPSANLEKIAVVTAINCAHELLRARANLASSAEDASSDAVASTASTPSSGADLETGSRQDDPALITERLKLLNDEVEALLAAQDED